MHFWIISFIIVEVMSIYFIRLFKYKDIHRIFYEDIPLISLIFSNGLYSLILYLLTFLIGFKDVHFLANIFIINTFMKLCLQLCTYLLHKKYDYFALYKRYLEDNNVILDSIYVLSYSSLYMLLSKIKFTWTPWHSLCLTILSYVFVVISFEDI